MTSTQKHSSLMRIPRLSSKKRPSNQHEYQYNDSSTVSISHQTHLALRIPEILEDILSCLTLSIRQKAARLVCKQWNAICKSLLPVTYTWHLRLTPNSDNNDDSDDNDNPIIQDLLCYAHSINVRVDNINLSRSTAFQQRVPSWAKMMAMLSSVIHGDHHHQQRLRPKIQTLHLKEGVLENFSIQLSQLPLISTLTTLRIDTIVQWDILHLFPIFKACPNLKELSIKPSYNAAVPNRSTFILSPQISTATASQESGDIRRLDPLPIMAQLRACSLYNMVITMPALVAFLQVSPRLSALVLARLYHYVRPHPIEDNNNSSLPRTIVDCVGLYCPTLKTFHFSMSNPRDEGINHELTCIFEKLPCLEEFSFADQDAMRPPLLRGLWTVANRITTLDLLPMKPKPLPTSFPIREILCSFEHLIHLRAPTAIYRIEDMEVKNTTQEKHARKDCDRNSPTPYDSANSTTVRQYKYTWACRGLKTLHMKVGLGTADSNDAERSLIIFGYLSKMCPQLQELQLIRWATNLSFEGGLCLMTRLRHLERIRIVSDLNCRLDKDALFWMNPAPPLPQQPLSAQGRLVYRLQRRQKDREFHRWYRYVPSDVARAVSALVARGRSDETAMRYIDDLLDWMEDWTESIATITATTSPPTAAIPVSISGKSLQLSIWPNLESFWLECPDLTADATCRQLEEVVRRVRPSVDFQLRVPSRGYYYLTTLNVC